MFETAARAACAISIDMSCWRGRRGSAGTLASQASVGGCWSSSLPAVGSGVSVGVHVAEGHQ
eukprot:2174214-Pyramimonas_sp.AAC.1